MSSYQDNKKKYTTLKVREILKELPPYVSDFFRGIEHTCSANTRLAYVYDIRIFLEYIHQAVPSLTSRASLKAITLEDLVAITPQDIERYLEYLTYYEKDIDQEHIVAYQNGENGKSRKLAALRTFYNYFYKQQLIKSNPTTLVDMPKRHEKPIIRLEVDEVANLLDIVESGEKLTEKQKTYHQYTRKRDLALIALLLGTGIRVSECVGINLEDIDFNYNGLKVTRKGGNDTIVYFSDEVEKILRDYLVEREKTPCKDMDNPLFLSLQNRRISVRSVQMLVKKYTSLVTSLKKITPHKLRSTYGTQLYQETGDIYLVADVLGHKDVNTTKKHYARMDEDRKRRAASVIKLRDN